MKPTILTFSAGYAIAMAIWSIAAARAEDSEGVDEDDVARARESAGDADHVRFGHAGVDEALRDRVAESVGLGLARQVRAEANDLRAAGAPGRAAPPRRA